MIERYFLGVDVGGTKTHALIVSEAGRVCGFGESGSGNPEGVGYDGLTAVLRTAIGKALGQAGLDLGQIAGAGLGIGGYDWPSEHEATCAAIRSAGLQAPFAVVNDAIIGLLAGSAEGWGVAVVAGTGCNCWGWDRQRQLVGRMTGMGMVMGEAAGAVEVVEEAVRRVARAWSRRGPQTRLAQIFVDLAGAGDVERLLEGISQERYFIGPEAAPLVFRAAAEGDEVAAQIIDWAGAALADLACGVVRQLNFEDMVFDVVMVGSLYDGGPRLRQALQAGVWALAPRARFLRLDVPPVVGGVLLGMEQVGLDGAALRPSLLEAGRLLRNGAG